MTRRLSDATLKAISELGHKVKFDEDVKPALAAVGLDVRQQPASYNDGVVFIPSTSSHIAATLRALDLSDPDVVSRVLRFTARIAEVYAAARDTDRSRLVRLRNALEDDGFSLDFAGDPLTAITDLRAATAGEVDTAAIRAELVRLERAIPDDPAAAIGRAKNLIEATAKLVLTRAGQTVSDSDKMPTLVQKASMVAGIHPTQAPSGPHRTQFLRIMGQLAAITQNLAELRNAAGDGHGATTVPADLTPAHGRLAARAATAWAAFVLDITMKP